MTLPWNIIVIVDIFGSALVLLMAFWCAVLCWDWRKQKTEDIFRDYIFLFTLAIVFFAISRSFGHLAKQLLLLSDMESIWQLISPFSGAVNSVTFVVIFAFGLYFHRFQRVHLRMEEYQNNLEEMIVSRTEELNNANATLENVLNSSNPLCIIAIDRTIIKTNNAYQALWPGNVKHVIRCSDSRPGIYCDTKQCPLEQVKAGEEYVYHETSKVVTGETKVFIVSARPFHDGSGKMIGIVESFQDISIRKQAELALASEREQLAVTLRSIADGVITTDLDGNVVLINKVTEQLTGWTQQEAVGLPVENLFNIIDTQTGKSRRSPVEKVLASGAVVALGDHTSLIAKDGTQYTIEDSGAPIFNRDSEIVGAVLVFRDVTEGRRIKKKLLKAQRLESIGVLAGGIAHDFNNILAAILGNVELAAMLVGPDAEAYPLLNMATKASHRAKDLTRQLLTFSKGGNPVTKITSIRETITESTDFILRGSSVSCKYSIPDDLWLVDIDSAQIGQVMQNLVINAKAAMPEGGEIEISGINVEKSESLPAKPTASTGQRFVAITVTDRGCGISEKNLETIFDPYFTTKKEGSGLGLAITHSIIQKHKGYIEVQSRQDVGTSFTLFLPVAKEQVLVVSQEKNVDVEVGQGMNILVMDDEEPVQEIIAQMLATLGHHSLPAANGKEAVQLFKKHQNHKNPVDMIIMDLTIPGAMGGKDTVQEILKIDPYAKVVVSSGYSNDPVMAHYEEYGFKAVMGKPFSLDDLKGVLKKVL